MKQPRHTDVDYTTHHREYHLGLTISTNNTTGAWQFVVGPINGDDSPFAQMEWGEVYNVETGEWESAMPVPDDDNIQLKNEECLSYLMQLVDHRLNHKEHSNHG